ncbi:MAG: PD-(D/E)XK nuclease family protein, partial [Gammaproteobacteria bacterium]|nr:PD-(D/E)XK nuclease family protein [Gammaproteobacteria bacterium]
LVSRAQERDPDDTIGILVRTRKQARLIVPQLRRLNIKFSGAGLEQPGETGVEQDLIALTRALSHRGDRTAWLALLRAPWCALSLHDLNALCGADPYADVLNQMHDEQLVAGLSAEGQQRVMELRQALTAIFALRGRYSLRDWVEGAWQRLGGPAAIAEPRGLELARQFFATLDECDDGGDIAEAFRLHEQLVVPEDTEASTDVRVHLLTLYKAKGLEYDVVILPALDGTTRGNDKPVIAWHEYQGDDDQPRYLLGPLETVGDDADPVQQLIRRFDDEQAGNERDRLLYVATTRARRELHFFCELKRDDEGELQTPRKGSLLERMWPVVPVDGLQMSGLPGTEEARETWVQPFIQRLTAPPVAAPDPVSTQVAVDAEPDESQDVTFDWAGSDAIRLGLVVHRCLQHIAEQQQPDWQDAGAIERMLLEAGVTSEGLATAAERVARALVNTRNDKDGQWVLDAHADSACELPVVVARHGKAETLIIDRTFVDSEGVRWIIDYKTSPHEGSDIDNFLAEQKLRYAEQLSGYRDAMQALEPERTIRTALYFPLQGRLSEYDN